MLRLKVLVAMLAVFLNSELKASESLLPSYILEERLVADLRMIANGSFAPLTGFMKEADYHSVLKTSRLANNALFPIPIVLPVPEKIVEATKQSSSLMLKDRYGHPLAILDVEEVYSPELEEECLSTCGTLDQNHKTVRWILSRRGQFYVGGKIHPLPFLSKLDQMEGVLPPEETKQLFTSQGWKKIVAFQTRNPLHQAHVALIQNCLSKAGKDAALFLNPVIGPTQECDVSAPVRKKCYEALRPYLTKNPLHIGYLPLAMRMAGPKEALLHALIRKNYGATHFIVGRDHAGPSATDSQGKRFYDPYAAGRLVSFHAKELGLEVLTSEEMVYVPEIGGYLAENELKPSYTTERISGTELRKTLQNGGELPSWFSFPEVLKILKRYYAKRTGVCLYLTGLPSAGKSTIASAVKEKLELLDPLKREVVILDGDMIRARLTSDLGFSKKDRSTNVQRIGYVASLIVQSGGICIAANIAPYEQDRAANRELISSKGLYFEVFVDTPSDICEDRDVKGLYKLARQGKIQEFTGVSDPYEIPSHPDAIINGSEDLSQCVDQIIDQLRQVYPLLKFVE